MHTAMMVAQCLTAPSACSMQCSPQHCQICVRTLTLWSRFCPGGYVLNVSVLRSSWCSPRDSSYFFVRKPHWLTGVEIRRTLHISWSATVPSRQHACAPSIPSNRVGKLYNSIACGVAVLSIQRLRILIVMIWRWSPKSDRLSTLHATHRSCNVRQPVDRIVRTLYRLTAYDTIRNCAENLAPF